MPSQTVESRVESLETRVTKLEELPARIDDLTSQVSQLRTEMRDEFSTVRSEMAAGFAAAKAETDGLAVQMRVLHEDVIARIAMLQEQRSRPTGRKPRKRS
jgi:phage host-nuclease inhibitor protein Gam